MMGWAIVRKESLMKDEVKDQTETESRKPNPAAQLCTNAHVIILE
jgi:hypothetical protein